jgi:carboxypeptidase Q
MTSFHVRPLVASLVTFALAASAFGQGGRASQSQPTIPPLPIPSMERYREAAGRIIGAALVDSAAYDRLAYLSDRIGHRLSGSPQLEQAVDWAVAEMRKDGLDNVRKERVMVPHWVRGEESAELLEPVRRPIVMLGVGNSVGTPPEGITADVVVVRNFAELETLGEQVRGKIVLYNVPFTTYGETVQYRGSGASRAAKYGAAAVLVRSVGPVSLRTPHTGALGYTEGVPKIPAAAVTIEDAETMARMQGRGERIRVQLKMGARMLPDAESANVIAELRGTERPDEIVLVGGHLDSWDVGTGSVDDGGGCVATWHAVRLLKRLGLTPRRTIRVVLWTNEENGGRGAEAYAKDHAAEIRNHVLAIESDGGVFKPRGFGLTANDRARATAKGIAALLEAIEANRIGDNGIQADTAPLIRQGVPGMGLDVDGTHYFDIHHTPADTMDKIDRHELALCVATLAVMAYVVADLPERLGQ